MESFQLCHSQNIILISNFPNCLPHKVSSNFENFEGVSGDPREKNYPAGMICIYFTCFSSSWARAASLCV